MKRTLREVPTQTLLPSGLVSLTEVIGLLPDGRNEVKGLSGPRGPVNTVKPGDLSPFTRDPGQSGQPSKHSGQDLGHWIQRFPLDWRSPRTVSDLSQPHRRRMTGLSIRIAQD